ncbi:MAG: mismatch-specific DNA-glycosylase, partial [Firmicutes bacterium]|nr:mismatch-specific DNA-glycosylase [Bacillota bacterium]
PSNRFYRLLHASGLTPVLHAPADSFAFRRLYGYGFTNIVARTTRRADELTAADYAQGRVLLHRKLQTYAPAIACFVGKGVYLAWSGRHSCDFGFTAQGTVAHVREFVAPGTSGLVRMRVEEQAAVYRLLADAVDDMRRGGWRQDM